MPHTVVQGATRPAGGEKTADGAALRRELPRVSLAHWAEIEERARSEVVPVVVEGAYLRAAAVEAWTPEVFAQHYGEREVGVAVALPASGVPYRDAQEDHQARITVRSLVERMAAGERCYLNQAALDDFPELSAALDLSLLAVPPFYGANLWVGNATRSGLHYDAADNVLVQLHGRKDAVLIAPRWTRSLAVFRDTPSKSQIDPDGPDAHHARRFASVVQWRGPLHPGDALFIPRGWWHHLVTPEPSMSVNIWHGGRLGFKDQVVAVGRSGARTLARVGWDFTWSGMLRRPYHQRMFSPPPLGVELHQRVTRTTR